MSDQYTCRRCSLSTQNDDRLCAYCSIGEDFAGLSEASRCHTALMAIARSTMRDQDADIVAAARAFYLLIQALPAFSADDPFWISVGKALDGVEQVCESMPARIESGRKFLSEMADAAPQGPPKAQLKLV